MLPIELFQSIQKVREQAPLVHNIANFVAMNFSANVLLAAGASPIMAHAPEEIPEIVKISAASVINIGTLDTHWLQSMLATAHAAREIGRPVVLDPVGAGATSYRTKVALDLLHTGAVRVIRGNAGEVMALAGALGLTKGVDSRIGSDAALDAASELSLKHECTICVSGETDYVVAGSARVALSNGHVRMTKITAMGCSASSLIGAFLAVDASPWKATQAAMSMMAIAGERAHGLSKGPGSYQAAFLDCLSSFNLAICDRIKARVL